MTRPTKNSNKTQQPSVDSGSDKESGGEDILEETDLDIGTDFPGMDSQEEAEFTIASDHEETSWSGLTGTVAVSTTTFTVPVTVSGAMSSPALTNARFTMPASHGPEVSTATGRGLPRPTAVTMATMHGPALTATVTAPIGSGRTRSSAVCGADPREPALINDGTTQVRRGPVSMATVTVSTAHGLSSGNTGNASAAGGWHSDHGPAWSFPVTRNTTPATVGLTTSAAASLLPSGPILTRFSSSGIWGSGTPRSDDPVTSAAQPDGVADGYATAMPAWPWQTRAFEPTVSGVSMPSEGPLYFPLTVGEPDHPDTGRTAAPPMPSLTDKRGQPATPAYQPHGPRRSGPPHSRGDFQENAVVTMIPPAQPQATFPPVPVGGFPMEGSHTTEVVTRGARPRIGGATGESQSLQPRYQVDVRPILQEEVMRRWNRLF
jgi:hypothetical protein